MKKNKRSEKELSLQTVFAHGLSVDEYQKITRLIGRTPNITELGIFSAMWNEHCSYKSSKRWLKELFSQGNDVICGPGENAGIIAIDEKMALAFKMESHNHPSFIEPFNGAATGVGGILRDVFTMGARPIAVMNSLSMGSVNCSTTKDILKGVVKGISHYGNSFGVPNIGGELRFHKSYNSNCLVNAFAAGLVERDKIFYSKATGINAPIIYMGAKTGKDGVGGATMASESFSEDLEDKKKKRPNVQIGDPFLEKKLMEACLELMREDCVIAIQDMGAAGLTCSSVEMGDKGNLGIKINLDYVPKRESNMTAYEIMLSESQERMLAVIKPGTVDIAQDIFEKWDLDFAEIGKTIAKDELIIEYKNKIEARLPLKCLSADAPQYDRKWSKTKLNPVALPTIKYNVIEALSLMVSSPNHCSKRWIWEQYDHMILNSTLRTPGIDAGVVKAGDTRKAIAFTSDCNPLFCKINPREGGKQAVAEAYRNLISVGAKPIAITDNLNFGNPEDPKVMGQFVECIKGITEACRTLNFPVVSGNVSFYNQTDGKSILPTPTIGGVGVIENPRSAKNITIQNNDLIYLVGFNDNNITPLSLLNEANREPITYANISVDLKQEVTTGDFILKLISRKLISFVHDVSDGGIGLALAEMSINNNIGLETDIDDLLFFFNETQGRYLIALNKLNEKLLANSAINEGITIKKIGKFTGTILKFGKKNICLNEIKNSYLNKLEDIFERN